MRKYFYLVIIWSIVLPMYGQDFDKQISVTCDSLAKKIINSKKEKVAIADFVNIDESITQLGVFISNEISAELSNLTGTPQKFKVLERSNLEQIYREKKLLRSSDGVKVAKELGKLDAADVLIFATITDFNGYYRITIKLLDTRTGNALSSSRLSLVKSPALENLNKNVIKISDNQIFTPTISYQEPKNNQIVETATASTGDFCFTVTSAYFPAEGAKIIIYKIDSNEIEKTIDVSPGAPSCAYNLEVGVHKVVVKWNGSLKKPENKEIRVKKGKEDTVNYHYQ